MDTAIGLIQVHTQPSTETKQKQSPSLTTDNIQPKPMEKSLSKTAETQKKPDYQDEVLQKKPEELNQSSFFEPMNALDLDVDPDTASAMEPVNAMDVPGEQKKELAYQVHEIKDAFERKDINLDTVIDKVKDIMDNAYKLSPKDTPYDDYETRLKAIQTWAKLLQIGKPQSVYNVLNMRGKPPQIN